MALARVKTWSSGEVLTASELNAEFNSILNNARDLISPLTASLDMNGFEFILDGDADTSVTSDTDDRIDLRLGGVDLFLFDGTAASLVNGLTYTGAATGSGASIASTGSDTNIPVTLKGKGTGAVILGQATSTDVRLAADQPIADSSGNEFVKFTKAATAVNEVTLANAATGNPPVISATGGDTNIPLRLTPKGTGDVQFTDGTDPTKIVAFELSGLTTATTRTLTVQDASDTLVGRATTDTLTNKDISSSTNTYRAASDTETGAIEVAVQSEMEAGSSTILAVTPGRQHLHQSAVKGWVMADTAAGQAAGYNVTSVTDNGAGDASINWATDFSSASYCAVATSKAGSGTSIYGAVDNTSFAAGVTRVYTAVSTTGTLTDPNNFMCAALGDQ